MTEENNQGIVSGISGWDPTDDTVVVAFNGVRKQNQVFTLKRVQNAGFGRNKQFNKADQALFVEALCKYD